jgi:hypothetical protein
MMSKIVLKVFLFIIVLVLLWNHLPYFYSNDKAVDYISRHAETKSKGSCAGYVMRGFWHGGCPVGLVPAYGYGKILPLMGFQEVQTKDYTPRKGDVSVLPQNNSHVFGHIAVYNGKQWVSDFRQNNMLCSKAYRDNGKFQIFRITDGWHWKHVWTSPVDWYGWIETAIKGWKNIKFV